MRFPLIGSIIDAAKRRFRGVKNRISSAISSRTNTPQTSTRSPVSVSSTGVGQAAGTVGALRDIVVDGSLSRAVAEQVGQAAVDILSGSVSPISRTGNLADSFRYSVLADGNLEVYSVADYALALTDPNSERGKFPVQNLLQWMGQFPDFQNLDDKQKMRMGFAIKYSILSGAGRGRTGRSRLISLPPVGLPAFDYIEESRQEIERQVEQFGGRIVGSIINVP